MLREKNKTNVPLEKFLSHCEKKKYPKGSYIFKPGDCASRMYFVLKGSLAILVEENDKTMILAHLFGNSFVGEAGFFVEATKRDVFLKAKEDCELAEIEINNLKDLLKNELKEHSLDIVLLISQHITKRLLDTTRKASSLAQLDVISRIYRTLIELTKEPSAMTHPQGMQIKVSRQDLSKMVGCSREMAGKVLKTLVERRKIYAKGKTVIVYSVGPRFDKK